MVLGLGFGKIAIAQQQPFYTQYILNPFISNPALAGIENYWDLRLSYRNQWQGIEGAPQTNYLTIHGPIKRMQYSKATTSTVSPPEPRKRRQSTSYWQQYKSAKPHAGIGFTALNDKIGPIKRYAANVAYAYHIGLSSKTSISAGLSGGIQSLSLNTDQLNFGPTNPTDPAIAANGVVNQIKPDVSFGLWLYSAFYFIGASSQNIIPFKINYSDNTVNSLLLVPHIMISGGYKFFLNEDLSFLPSTMVRFVKNTPLNFDVNAKVQYRDNGWIGFSYRNSNSFAAMLGMNINSTFSFGYSYDITTSHLKYGANGTHEVVLGILLGNRNRVSCPKDFW